MAFSAIAQTNSQKQTDVTAYVDNKQKVLVSVAGKRGISGWLFDIPTGEKVTHEADMSQHYTEQGSFLNDTRILKPTQITLTGYVGELVSRVPQKGTPKYALQQAQNRLGAVNAYLGPFTQQATQKAAAIVEKASYVYNQIGAIAKRATNVVKFFSGNEAVLTAQQKAYLELYSLFVSGAVVEVQTPWRFFPSMQILSLVASQDEMTNDYTDFSVTLQEYRTAGVVVTDFNENLFTPAESAQSSAVANQGKVQGKTENVSILDQVFYGGK